MIRGLGYRFDLEDRQWLRANQLAFRGSPLETLRVPAEVDPRSYLSLRDQQQLGSCSGASRTALEERLNQLATKTTAKLLLSMMFAYLTNQKCCDCFGKDEGATISGSIQAAGQYGICHESLMPPLSFGTPNSSGCLDVVPVQHSAEISLFGMPIVSGSVGTYPTYPTCGPGACR